MMSNSYFKLKFNTPYILSKKFNGDCSKLPTSSTKKADLALSQNDIETALQSVVAEISELQASLMADKNWSVLCIFQAMDAAGKDSTIKNVFSGVNPAGFQIASFKQPSDVELSHDFMWRAVNRLPQKGYIGVFNRSHYEETLVVRVHPEYLSSQKLPNLNTETLWLQRFETISDCERMWANNGMIVLKFFLNVSKNEQARRFISRLESAEKQWKYNPVDIKERALWDKYQLAYGDILKHTHKPYAPWFAIPADNKPLMRLAVAKIIRDTLKQLPLKYPILPKEIQDNKDDIVAQLKNEIGK